jgi:hypothetical protein
MTIWYISVPFGNLAAIWYIFPRLGILSQEKSGNPFAAVETKKMFSPPFMVRHRGRSFEQL